MTDGASSDGFDQLYDGNRDRLYRALVLATDDRDISLEAVDGAFVAQRRRIVRRSLADPAADVLRRAVAKVGRRPGDDIRGFRLPDAHLGEQTDQVVKAVRTLDLTDRMTLIGKHYLDWDPAAVGIAVGLDADAAVLRTRSAVEKVAGALDVSSDAAAVLLGEALPEAAAAVSSPLSRRDTVRSEGTTQRVGAALAGFVGILLLIGGSVLGVNALAGGTDGPGTAAGTTATGPQSASTEGGVETPAPDVELSDIDVETVEWIETGLPIQQGELTAATAGPEGIVAIGTSYGGNTQSMIALTSETGIDWTAEELPTARNSGGWISSMSYSDGRYIAVGSIYDERDGRDTPTVFVSEDAVNWSVFELPIENTVEIDGIQLTVYTSVSSATFADDAITVIGSQYGDFGADIEALVRDQLPEDISLNNGWGTSNTGLEIYGPNGDQVFSATWEELGLAPELASFLGGGRPITWTSTDGGETWDIGDSLGFGPGAQAGQFATAGDRTVAMVYGDFGAALWGSTDTGEWERVDLGRGATVQQIAQFGDAVLAAGADPTGAATVWRSDDGVTWVPTGGETLSGISVNQMLASPYGLVVVGQSVDEARIVGPAIVETDEYTIEISTDGRHTVKDLDGAVVAEIFGEELVTEGSTISIFEPDSGDHILTVDRRQIDEAWEAAYREFEGGGFEGEPLAESIVTVSRDGVTWVRLDATDALPPGFYPNIAVLGPNSLLLSGYAEGPNFNGGMATLVALFDQ